MDDLSEIRALLDRYSKAIHDKDATALVACYAPDATAFELAPPLSQETGLVHDIHHWQQWFDSWDGPITSTVHAKHLKASGELAAGHSLLHMAGRKKDGHKVDLWFRHTVQLERQNGQWLITHVHNSVPFAMDGSGKALLHLKPAAA